MLRWITSCKKGRRTQVALYIFNNQIQQIVKRYQNTRFPRLLGRQDETLIDKETIGLTPFVIWFVTTSPIFTGTGRVPVDWPTLLFPSLVWSRTSGTTPWETLSRRRTPSDDKDDGPPRCTDDVPDALEVPMVPPGRPFTVEDRTGRGSCDYGPERPVDPHSSPNHLRFGGSLSVRRITKSSGKRPR